MCLCLWTDIWSSDDLLSITGLHDLSSMELQANDLKLVCQGLEAKLEGLQAELRGTRAEVKSKDEEIRGLRAKACTAEELASQCRSQTTALRNKVGCNVRLLYNAQQGTHAKLTYAKFVEYTQSVIFLSR